MKKNKQAEYDFFARLRKIGIPYCLFVAGVMLGYAWCYICIRTHVPYYIDKDVAVDMVRQTDHAYKWSVKSLSRYMPDHKVFHVEQEGERERND